MAFRGVTFASQNATPKNDRGLYMAHYGDGILWGCEMNISGDELIVQSGELIMGGAVVQVDGATSIDLSGRTIQTGYIQVVLNIDLTQGEGQQVYETFVESASTAFPDLTQEDIWSTGEIYQIELAVIQTSGGNLTIIYSSMGGSDVVINGRNNKNAVLALFYEGAKQGYVFYDPLNFATRLWNEIANSGVFLDDNGIAIIHTANNNISLRPNGRASQVGEFYIAPSGEVNFRGYGRLYADSTNVILAHPSGIILLRPNGRGSSNGEFAVDTSGHITWAGIYITNAYGRIHINSSQAIVAHNGGSVVLRPNGFGSSAGEFYIDTSGYIHSPATYNRSAAASPNVAIGSGGEFFRATSLRAYKENIQDITEEDAEKGYNLRPVSFVPKKTEKMPSISQHEQYGFIAEEVDEVLPNLATYDENDELNGVAYDRVCAILLKQNQMLKARVDELEKRVAKLEAK